MLKAGSSSLIGVAMAGCGGQSGTETATQTGTTTGGGDQETDSTLDIIWPGGINNMNPLGWLTIPDFDAVRMMYEPLTSADSDGKAIPHLAKDWEVSSDGSEYTWTIQEDATWHDGEPLTAEDVAFSFKFVKTQNWPYYGSLSSVIGDPEQITVEDEQTVVTPLAEPYAPLPLVLTDLGIIVPKHIWSEKDDPTGAKNVENPIGSGPFKFVDRKPDQFIEWEKNENYWGETPAYDNVIVQIIPSTDNQILSVKKGESDMLRVAAGPQASDVVGAEGTEVVRAGTTFIRYITFQTNRKPFSDVNVRKAVAYATNRQQFVDFSFGGFATKGTSVLAPGLRFYQNPDVKGYQQDVERAKQLLSENGYEMDGDVRVTPDGERMEYEMPISNTGNYPRMANLLKRQLSDIGIKLSVSALDSNSFTDRVTVNHDYPLTISAWRLWFDPDPFLSPSFEETGTLNFAEYQNEELNELMVKQRQATDPEQRQQHIYRIQEIIAEEIPWYTMLYPDLLFVINSNNWTNPDPIPRYGLQSPYGNKPGTGPLLQLQPK